MQNAYRVYRYDHLEAPAVTAGSAAVLIGAQNGLFPDMGLAVPGEMGGLWAGEKKVCDGFFLAVDDVPLTAADACEQDPVQTAFHYRMQKEGLHIVRRQVIPDGVSGVVIDLEVENLRGAPRLVEISFTVRTDILTVPAARGEDGMELGRDVGEYDEATQAFYARDSRNPWHAVWGADAGCRVLQSDLPAAVYGFGNTQGKGINGRLFYRLRVGARASAGMRLFIAGGYASQMKAEDALGELRENAGTWIAQKAERMNRLMRESDAAMPDERLTRCLNWTKIVNDWLTRELPDGGLAMCADLPEHPALYGEGWAKAMSALLPLGGGRRVQRMLETLLALSERAQLAPGRLARSVSLGGRVLQAGGPKESALFVWLVHQTLLYTGDRAFAARMLPATGLCVSYLRRATRGFEDVREDILRAIRLALTGQAFILRATGADDAGMRQALALLPEEEEDALDGRAPLEAAAGWHGRQGHVEQMIGCLSQMARDSLPGIPGALRACDMEKSALIASRAAAGFVWPIARDLFGIRPDACEKTLSFAPHTPIGWDGWAIERVALGGGELSVRSERVSPSSARYTISMSEPGWRVLLEDGSEHALEGECSFVLGD